MLKQLAPFLAVVGMGLVASRRHVVRRLLRSGATDPASAKPVPRRLLTGFWLRRLSAAGVIGSDGDDRYWLNVEAFRAYRGVRRRRAAIVLGLALLAFLVMKLTGGPSRWLK